MQLSAEQAKQLEQSGVSAKVLGDYDSFKVVEIDEKALAALPEGAQTRDDFNDLLLNAGTIDTASPHGQSLRGMKLQASGKRFRIVQFSGPIKEEWVKELEATGVKVVSYIPNNAYLVYGDVASLSSMQRHVTSSASIQWDGDYLDDYKLNPAINTLPTKTYSIQLIKDEEANGPTLELIRSKQSRNGTIQEALGYVNVVAYLTVKDLYEIATRPDVLSIAPRPTPTKFDERQDMILAGQITGTNPSGPGYLAWLASKGFTQAQFTASGFGVDVSDSGMDNGTQAPNHFGLYVSGDISNASRVVYNRLEGTANSGSTLQGCDGHGNLNTHIVAGFSNKTGAPFTDETGFTHGLGIAPFVKVGSSVIFDPDNFTDPDYEDLQSRAYRDGSRISTNSWGAGSNLYDADAQRYDALVRDAQPTGSAVPNTGNQEMVIVFAAGNDGPAANSVGTPGTAKNIITVGASENVRAFGLPDLCDVPDADADSLYDMEGFSSRGPASDGRKKPDIVAPGTHISGGVAQAAGQRANPPANPNGQALSCFDASGVCGGPNDNFYPVGQQWYTASSGTSHSTPAVAGGAALVRQYFINQGITPPSAAMTKGYLMNSARYMTGAGANDNLFSNSQGMGLMDLGMAFDGTQRLLDDENPTNLFTATGQTRTFTGVVADTTKPFRVTVAWTDAPGSTTGSAWKNNLDLSVTVGANTYKGNVFVGGNSVTGGTADGSNNVESVFLPAGTEGSYTVTVSAANINSDGVPGNASSLDQDFALVAYNTCTTAVSAPTVLSATANGNNRIDVSWTENGAASYNIYRATTAGGPYSRVGSATTSPYADVGVSGSTVYYYVVRAVQCAESPKSNEVSATTTGQCTLPPTFAGLTSAVNGQASTCANTLTWAAATPICGGTLSYSVYRSTTSGFTPSSANKIATGLTGTTFSDDLNLTAGSTYYYVVRATEVSNATNEDTNTVQKSTVPTGAMGTGIHYFDDLDGNRPANAASYWIATGTTINLTASCHYQSATHSYRFGATNTTCGGTYPASSQATLSLGGNGTVSGINGFAIPSLTVGPQMTFNLWYNLEADYDGAWLVYSTVSASGPWIQVLDTPSSTAPYITAGGYDNVLDSSPTTLIWNGTNTGTNGSLKAVTVNLSALAGRTVWFGFKFSSDSSVNREGVYLDDVRVNADSYATCTTQTPPPGPAVAYRLTGLPASVQAGTAASFTLTALDAVGNTATGYNGTATFTSSDPQAVLPANVTFTSGVATGSVTFRSLGSRSLTATDALNPSLTASGSINVTVGPAAALAFTVQPSNAAAGVSNSPAVKVGLVDQFGNPITTGTNSVTLALGNNPSGGTLAGTTTATMTAGVATFSNLSINKVGTGYTLVASAAGLTSATSSAFNITPGTATKLVFITQPSNTSVGTPITPAVQVAVQDSQGNTTTSTANITLALGSNPGGATLAGTTTVAAVNGVATFSDLSLNKVGTGYTLTATATSLTSATSSAFNVAGGAATKLAFITQPSNAGAGVSITPAVQVAIQDSLGNTTGSTASVTLALGSNPGSGTLAGTSTVAAVNGVATFSNLSLDKAGTGYTLTATAASLTSATSSAFNITAGTPTRVLISRQPTNTPVGSAITPSVQVSVVDALGNVSTSATNTISIAIGNNPGSGTLSGATTANAVNGVASFADLKIDHAGIGYTLVASSNGLAADTSASFNVGTGAAAKLGFTSSPSSNVTSGATFTVKVAVQDADGNTVTGASDSVTLALTNASGATLSGATVTTAINGVATFTGLSVDKVGSGYQLQATATGLTNATSPVFGVDPGTAASLAFLVQPSTVAAGALITPAVKVAIQDAHGNLVSSATDSVTVMLASNPSGGTLSGTTTVSAINGVATFDTLKLDRVGTGYTLSAKSGALTGVSSTAFDVRPGTETKLVFRQAPTNTTAGTNLGVVVEFRDAYDNVANTTASVTVSLQGGQGGTLNGTVTVAAVGGVATFDNLAIKRVGTGYQLAAHASGLADIVSAAFDITPGPAAALTFSVQPSSAQAGTAISPAVKVTIQDAYDNVATSATDAVTLTLGSNPNGGTLAGTKTVSAISGVATFSDLSINHAGQGYTLKASSGALTSATSTAFDITSGGTPKLVFRTTLDQGVAGVSLPSIEVEARDDQDNLIADNSSSVAISLGENPTGAQLMGLVTVSMVNGVAKFDGLSLQKAGNGYTLVASSQGFTSATSTAFNIKAGEAASYTLTFTSNVMAGQAATISAAAYDAYGNPATEYAGTVKVTSSDAAATYAANATFTAGVLQNFAVTFKSAGTQTLTVTDSGKASLTATAQFNVTALAQPTVSVTSPAGGTTVSGKVSVSATGAVAQGTTLVKLAILVDGAEIASGTDTTVTGTWDSSKAQAGAHIITAVITDGVGNTVTSAPVIVSVEGGGCGCGTTSSTDAGVYLGLLVLARYALGRRRAKAA